MTSPNEAPSSRDLMTLLDEIDELLQEVRAVLKEREMNDDDHE
jgi:hypothetical protein